MHRIDLERVPLGALAQQFARSDKPFGAKALFITPHIEQANQLVGDLRFFLKANNALVSQGVWYFPSYDHTPFVDVLSDRRQSFDRLSALSHLASSEAWHALVAPIGALLRKMPSASRLRKASITISIGDELDRDALLHQLVHIGYLRVPMVEDPGCFAVRGYLLDIFPPQSDAALRIEFNGDKVESVHAFDPSTQRLAEACLSLFIPPVSDLLFAPEHKEQGLQRVRALLDESSVPSLTAQSIIADLKEERQFLGMEHYLPAFVDDRCSPLEWIDADTLVIVDPAACIQSANDVWSRAARDRDARSSDGKASFSVDDFYLSESTLAEHLSARKLVLAHRVAVHATLDADTPSLDVLQHADAKHLVTIESDDLPALRQTLRNTKREAGAPSSFELFSKQCLEWLDTGMHIVVCTRTQTQGERVLELLKAYSLPLYPRVEDSESVPERAAGTPMVRVCYGTLKSSFQLTQDALVFVAEEELFGVRTRGTTSTKKRSFKSTLRDLQDLKLGDLVVHEHHGIGRYLGLERKTLPLSKADEMRGVKPVEFEVLVVEYAAGDRLFLPITKLNAIQRYQGGSPNAKLDRLGGKSFAVRKAKVQRSVKKLADDLLKLYAQRKASARPALNAPGRDYREFEATFPYDETPDQAHAIDDVISDLQRSTPMDRLVCGDVGFGKTEVALRAAFLVALSGKQVAVMCPTTVLAQQHLKTFRDRFQDYPVTVRGLSRFTSKTEQIDTLQRLKQGTCEIVVGTHRLLSKDVHYKNLGLLIVDEEQRFGVSHKERLKQIRAEIDVLTLSATPIPRTLQFAIGGLRDLSLITTAPIDRRSVRTYVSRWEDHTLREAIQYELSRTGQIFFVYNRIEGLYERARKLQDLVPKARIAVAHGQMREEELERVMTAFVEGEYDILCATAIIESGLDIPRANTIIIDRADAFGLAQLYQLRGRVGRAKERSYCYLLTPAPSTMTDEARMRIEALERFSELGSGFHIASLDMELRGAGDLLGAEQSGQIASVGFDLFITMLEEAVAELQGQPVARQFDPEIHVNVPYFLPENYIDDVGLRLSLYKRFSEAETEEEVDKLAEELEERFGALPEQAKYYTRIMQLKPGLRRLGVLACEVYDQRFTLHLALETTLDPAKVLELVTQLSDRWKLTPDMKLSYYPEHTMDDALSIAHTTLQFLETLKKENPPTQPS